MNFTATVSTIERPTFSLPTRPSCQELATLPLGAVLYFALIEALTGGTARAAETRLSM
jgi:hypothetical protein